MARQLRLFCRRREEKRRFNMTVKDVMTKEIATCRPDTNLALASALMWENDCGVVPVLTENGELAGILTDRDICIALGTRDTRSSELTARDVAGSRPWICKPTDDVRAALEIMRHAKIRRLPAVNENGVLEGMVSISDIVLFAQRGDGKTGSSASHADVVTALQAIYSRNDRIADRAAAA